MKIKSFLWILLFGVFCSNSMAELPKVIAHRGYWKTPSSAQNSLRALELADSIGVYGSEFDVWLTKDDVLIVNHDAVINGMDIESSSSKMLLKQKLKNGETVPTLDAFLNRAKKLSVRLICELKPHKDKQREAEAVKRIVEMVRKKGLEKRVEYITFSAEGLLELIEQAPKGTPVYYLNGSRLPKDLKFIDAAGQDYHINVFRKHIGWIRECHDLGLKVNVWTVNSLEDMQWCIDRGVDYITTDEPERLQKLLRSQRSFHDVAGFLPVYGKIRDCKNPLYSRLSSDMQPAVRKALWNLSQNTAGLYVRFRTNSTSVGARWTVKYNNQFNHITATAVKGLDLYCLQDGKWQFVNSAIPTGKENHATIVENMLPQEREFMLYLPLYDGVDKLEIGIDPGAEIVASELNSPNRENPIVMYGTSILQGASASRPGMAATNIIGRRFDREVVNLGFSANAFLDKEIAELMSEVEASAYVLDFVPNASVSQIKELTIPFYRILRKKHRTTPIIFVEDPQFPSAVYNRVLADEIREKNEALQLVYKELQKEKEKNIYYVPSQALIGDDYEATVDGIHFTDLGQFRYAECIGDCLERAFRKNTIKDLALIYQGGINRMDWTEEQFRPYVMHQFQDGRKEWLFDGFLFLEFSDGKGRRYAQGYGKDARKQEWEWLLQRLFEEGKSLSALDACIETVKKEIGEPEFRHRVVIGLPAAMFRQRDWGELNGKTLCFLYREDQVAATRWYVDRVLESFRNANYKNLDLAGFYWVDEDIAYNGDLSLSVSEYIHSKNLLFYWIPYWKAVGYDKWRELGFDMAYLQPNHFFEENIPDSRLEEACKESEKNGMAIEMEFDSRALSDYEPVSFRSRMKSYIDVFKDNGVFFDLPIAYYSGSRAIYEMYKSEDERDKEIMDELCELIVERHKK